MAGCSLIAEAVRDDGDFYYGSFYQDGVVFCACEDGGLRAYSFDGTNFALLDAIDDGGWYYEVWSDGTYIYTTCGPSGLRVYSWDGANFGLIDTDFQGGTVYKSVWGDGTYIYVGAGVSTLYAYTFNGVALTHMTTHAIATGRIEGLCGDGNYLYVALDRQAGVGAAIRVFNYDGAAFNEITSRTDLIDYYDVNLHNNYIIATGQNGAYAYTFNGAALAVVDNIAEAATIFNGVVSDGYYIYMSVQTAPPTEFRAYSFANETFILEYTINTTTLAAGYDKMRNVGDFIYFPASVDGIRAITALFADFSINDDTLFGSQIGQLTCHCGLPEAMGVWVYDFGDGTASALKNPSKQYSSHGTFTITLTATRGGLTETHSITVVSSGGGLSASPENGVGPLEVQFTDQSGGNIISREIYFGDGDSTTELNPTHTYMPGEYTVTYIVYDNEGNRDIITLTIYVYDSDYTGDGVHVPYSTVCYRHAVKPLQGIGVVPWGGQYWLWPEVYVGTAKGFDAANEPVSIVFNNATGQFFRIGIPDLWQDRVGAYAAYDIPTRIRFRELISRGGEMEQIIHREHHAHLRPYYEDNRSVSGFNRDGFLENFAVTGRLFFDGEPTTPGAILQRVLRLADYAFRQHRRVRRVQFELETNKSAYRGVGTQANIEELDKKPPPPENRKAETGWQMEFRTPDIWVSRNSTEPTQNRATGLELTGAYDILTDGPDSRGGTAMAFAPAQGLNVTLDFTANNFTILVWLAQMATYPGTIWQFTTSTGGTLLVQILDIGGELYARFNDGVNLFTQLLSWNGLSWMLLTVQKEGDVVRFFENNALLGNHNMIDNSIGYGGASMIINGATVTIADARRVPRAVSLPAIQDYYRAVTQEEGKGYLPVMR